VILVPVRHLGIALAYVLRELEVRPVIPLLRQRRRRGEIHRVFDGDFVAQAQLVVGQRQLLAPDWICEVLSPSTEAIDRGKKLRIYARERVAHAWLIDPLRRSLEVLALESGSLEQIEQHHGDSAVRARPFDAVELELRALWSTASSTL